MHNNILFKLIKYLSRYKLDLTIVMIALSIVSISLLMIGDRFKNLIDKGLKQNHIEYINHSIISIIMLILIFSVSSFFRSYFINNTTEKVINQLKQEAYNNIINFNISVFEELKIGDIISRLTIDLELLSKLIINFLSFFVRNSIMLIGSIIFMFVQSTKLALIVFLIIPLLVWSLIKLGHYVKKLSKNVLTLQSSITANIEETITNIIAIQAFNQQKNMTFDFSQQIDIYLQQASKRLKIRSIFFAVTIGVILLSITIVIWAGSIDILSGNLSPGEMISFSYFAIVAGVSSGGIFEFLSEIQLSFAASKRVFALLDKSQTGEQHINNSLTSNKKNNLFEVSNTRHTIIEFDKVNFSYPSRPQLLLFNQLSFKINKGKFIGIVGRSGAGKSTIMQLLLKFYLPISGKIKIAEQDISQIAASEVRKFIAYIPQEPKIFSGSIKENIIFAKPNATKEEIIWAADNTGLMDFAKNLKDGLDTQIGEKGVRLSGGQKQRIAISRALIYKPEILLLDEATSGLDSESEQKLYDRLQKIMSGKTILSIAHRISSIEQADEILVIDEGKLIARNTHRTLLGECNIYQTLCREQLI